MRDDCPRMTENTRPGGKMQGNNRGSYGTTTKRGTLSPRKAKVLAVTASVLYILLLVLMLVVYLVYQIMGDSYALTLMVSVPSEERFHSRDVSSLPVPSSKSPWMIPTIHR